MQALIITGGSIEDTFALDFIKKNSCDLMIAADSGMEFFYRNSLVPDEIVGDFDSVKTEVLDYFKQNNPDIRIRKFQPEKDETDTEIALRVAIEAGCEKVWLLGGTGTRLDHVLGNIQLLGMAMERGCECMIVDSCNRIRMLQQGIKLKRKEQYGDYVSLIPYTESVEGLTLTGMKYPLENFTLKGFSSLGVSNEIVEDTAEISFQKGILIVIEAKDKA